MKRVITLFFTIIIYSITFGQQNNVGLVVRKDDASPFYWRSKNMWVGLRNYLQSDYIGSKEILKIWADNATVDTALTNLCIVPIKSGKVTVYSIQKIYSGVTWDTVSTKNMFTAITPPEIKIQIIDNFKKDTTIKFMLIDKKTNKVISKRYEVGRVYEPNIYNTQDSLIGQVQLCFGTEIQKEKLIRFIKNNKIERGYKMKIHLIIRDLQTDLLVPADEVTYLFQ